MRSDMPMRKIFVHVGMTKTGSSAIQLFLRNNKAMLDSHDIFYADSPSNHMSHFPYIHGDRALELCEMIQSSGRSTAVISDENLYKYYWDPAQRFLRQISENFNSSEIKVIVYFRPQHHWIQSIYQQYVTQWEHRFSGEIETFLKYFEADMNYGSILKFLQGNSNSGIVARCYYSATQGGGVVSDFLQQLGVDDVSLDETLSVNPSLGLSATRIVREINTIGYIRNREVYDEFINFLKKISVNSDKFGLLSLRRSQMLMEKHRVGNLMLKKFMEPDHWHRFSSIEPLLESEEEVNIMAEKVFCDPV